MRLIDADALLEKCNKDRTSLKFAVLTLILHYAPTIDAEPAKHGKWEDRISCQVDEDAYHVANCSECKAEITIDPNYDSYCPNCGAKMDKE